MKLRSWISAACLCSFPLAGQSEAPTFEVASIRAHGPGVLRPLREETGPGRFARGNTKVKDLVCWAYDLPTFQISGGPDWFNSRDLRSNRYDVEAKIDGPTELKDIKLMVQSLLADRFQLRIHRATREVPVYALLVARNGPRIRTAKDTELGSGPAGFQVRYGTILVRSAPLASLVAALNLIIDRPVLDKTGLDEKYDFRLEFDQSSTGRGGELPYDVGKPSIFTAVEEQLGLKLEPQHADMEMLVVDNVEMPSDN